MNQEGYCKQIITWGKGRAGEVSTWRGILLAGTSFVAAVNPVAGIALAKITAAAIGAIEIFRVESK